jgi:hypothetical protein
VSKAWELEEIGIITFSYLNEIEGLDAVTQQPRTEINTFSTWQYAISVTVESFPR